VGVETADAVEPAKSAAAEPIVGESASTAEADSAAEPVPCPKAKASLPTPGITPGASDISRPNPSAIAAARIFAIQRVMAFSFPRRNYDPLSVAYTNA
jgi:hypothetical protein